MVVHIDLAVGWAVDAARVEDSRIALPAVGSLAVAGRPVVGSPAVADRPAVDSLAAVVLVVDSFVVADPRKRRISIVIQFQIQTCMHVAQHLGTSCYI